MRAREFTINIPINIKINGDDEPEITAVGQEDPEADSTWVPPLQQKIELAKASLGKQSDVIDQLIGDDDGPFEG